MEDAATGKPLRAEWAVKVTEQLGLETFTFRPYKVVLFRFCAANSRPPPTPPPAQQPEYLPKLQELQVGECARYLQQITHSCIRRRSYFLLSIQIHSTPGLPRMGATPCWLFITGRYATRYLVIPVLKISQLVGVATGRICGEEDWTWWDEIRVMFEDPPPVGCKYILIARQF